MPEPTTGVTGTSPAPSSGVSGSSPAPTTTSSKPSSAPTSSPSQGKIDYGMGPRKETTPANQWDNIPWNDIPDEVFWDKNGERIYKHDRFKELNGYKQKYQEVEPIKQFVDNAGGLAGLQKFQEYLGPIWSHLSSLGEKDANQVWTQLLPYLQSVLSGKAIPEFNRTSAVEAVIEEDPFDQRLKPLQEELGTLKETIKQREIREQQDWQERVQDARLENLDKYKSAVSAKLKEIDPTGGIDEDLVEDWIISNLWKHMPRSTDGKYLNPLDMYNEKALMDTIEKVVLPRVRKFEGYAVNKTKKLTEDGGPSIPDTSGGQTAALRQPTTLAQKQALMRSKLRQMST